MSKKSRLIEEIIRLKKFGRKKTERENYASKLLELEEEDLELIKLMVEWDIRHLRETDKK